MYYINLVFSIYLATIVRTMEFGLSELHLCLQFPKRVRKMCQTQEKSYTFVQELPSVLLS